MKRASHLLGIEAVDVAQRLRGFGDLVFFDTAGNVPSQAGRSFSVIAAGAVKIYRGSLFSAADVASLRECMTRNRCEVGDQSFPAGGLCGFVAYDGEFVLGEYLEMLVRDEETGEWWEKGALSSRFYDVEEEALEIGKWSAKMSEEAFLAAVRDAKEWIAAGDIYQVNLSQSFTAQIKGSGSLFPLFQTLRLASPAPMCAWLHLDGKEILSTSPELFLKITGNLVETRPIKGTRPRFSDAEEDMRSAEELQSSEKEVSELIMITDLLRNDLGQVCEYGSVEVSNMLQLESLAQVHHLVSTIRGVLKDHEDALSTLVACFPGGSITGAPKKRAMEIIDKLEPVERGIYCGALGYLGFNGETQFNIAIRTLIRDSERLSYHVGAGIVADSKPEDEYRETLHKAEGIRRGLEEFKNAQ